MTLCLSPPVSTRCSIKLVSRLCEGWWHGVVVSGVCRMNEVNPHQAPGDQLGQLSSRFWAP